MPAVSENGDTGKSKIQDSKAHAGSGRKGQTTPLPPPIFTMANECATYEVEDLKLMYATKKKLQMQ